VCVRAWMRERGEGEASAVLRPFYTQQPCGDQEGKWGVATGAMQRREAGEGRAWFRLAGGVPTDSCPNRGA
jgi:hypothetical protein